MGGGCVLPGVRAEESLLQNVLQTHILRATQVPHCITHSLYISPKVLVVK